MYIFNALSVILIVIGLPPAITKHSIGHGIVALLGFSWWVFLLGLVVHGWVTDRFDFGRYLKKAEQGDDFARLYVAGVHESRKKQYREAVRWYRASADQGSPAGQYHLGRMYQLGLGVEQDLLQALPWYRKAADQGDPWARRTLGYLYEKGIETGQPLDARTQAYLMGNLFYSGKGPYVVTRKSVRLPDYRQAHRWYRKAADQGDAAALGMLGVMYQYGKGAKPDLAESYAWHSLAAAGGEPAAREILTQLRSQMTPRQVERAERRAADRAATFR